jgi:hypothetical protein
LHPVITTHMLTHNWPDSMKCGPDGRACPSPGAGCPYCGVRGGVQQTITLCTPRAGSSCSPSCTLIRYPTLHMLTHSWRDCMKCGADGRACPSTGAGRPHCGEGGLKQTLGSCIPGAESSCSPSCTLLLYPNLNMMTHIWPDSMKCGADGSVCPSPGAGCPHCEWGGGCSRP